MKRIKRVNQQEKKMKSLKRNYQKEVERGNPVMDSAMNSIRKEIEILNNCRHPNVVRLLEVIDDAEDNKVYLSKYFRSSVSAMYSLNCPSIKFKKILLPAQSNGK